MLLEGSCHCGAVHFRCESRHPVPYQRCYCSICRKTGGGGGYLINTEADANTLEVTGREHVRVYQAMIERDGKQVRSRHERHFCGICGSHLWAFNDGWPELLHPVAGAIDTPLDPPPSNVHIFVGSKAPWVEIEGGPDDARFDEYPERSLADWHRDHGVEVD
jgi:hypothetical protein